MDARSSYSEVETLRTENEALRARIVQLTHEVNFLRTHFALAQGMKGETLVVKLSGGTAAAKYAEVFDIMVGSRLTVEVKFSKLNTPKRDAQLRRWNWSKPLGWKDKGKNYDFLVLVGEKDERFADQYPDDAPYVFFVIPRCNVGQVLTKGATIGSQVQVNTNLAVLSTPASLALKRHLVSAEVATSLLQAKV